MTTSVDDLIAELDALDGGKGRGKGTTSSTASAPRAAAVPATTSSSSNASSWARSGPTPAPSFPAVASSSAFATSATKPAATAPSSAAGGARGRHGGIDTTQLSDDEDEDAFLDVTVQKQQLSGATAAASSNDNSKSVLSPSFATSSSTLPANASSSAMTSFAALRARATNNPAFTLSTVPASSSSPASSVFSPSSTSAPAKPQQQQQQQQQQQPQQRQAPAGAHQRRGSDEGDIDALLHDIDQVTEKGPATENKSAPIVVKGVKGVKTLCKPILLVGATAAESGVGGAAGAGGGDKNLCTHLFCTQCDHPVIRLPQCVWTRSDRDGSSSSGAVVCADYLFFRNHVPNIAKLKTATIPARDAAAYCCQCAWISVRGVENLTNAAAVALGQSAAPYNHQQEATTSQLKWACRGSY